VYRKRDDNGQTHQLILADATLKTIDRLSRRGQRSRFIERAVQHYVSTNSPQALQER